MMKGRGDRVGRVVEKGNDSWNRKRCSGEEEME
jgi:hypothetical protein